MSLVPFASKDANGNPQNVGVNQITINGVVYNLEAIGLADPETGATANVTTINGVNALLVSILAGSAPLPVQTVTGNSTQATVAPVQVGTGSATLLAANPLRQAGKIYNEGSVPIYVCYGPVANPQESYSLQLSAGDPPHEVEKGYTGIITGTTGPNVNSTATIWTTEFIP